MRGRSGTEHAAIQPFIQEHLPVFKASRGNDPEQNARMIHESNSEHLLIFKSIHGDNPEKNAGIIHESNPDHLLICMAWHGVDLEHNAGAIHKFNSENLHAFKAPCGDDPEQNAGTIHYSNPEHLHSIAKWAKDMKFWENAHLPQCVPCHMSQFMCHNSYVVLLINGVLWRRKNGTKMVLKIVREVGFIARTPCVNV